MSIYLGSQAVTVYLGAVQVTSPGGAFLDGVQVFPAGPSVPGAPGIDGASGTNGSTAVSLFAGTDDGGSAITSYEFTFDDVPVTPATSDLSTLSFTFSANYNLQDVRARAVNAVGAGPYSEPAVVG
jgi:hypothetical protein